MAWWGLGGAVRGWPVARRGGWHRPTATYPATLITVCGSESSRPAGLADRVDRHGYGYLALAEPGPASSGSAMADGPRAAVACVV